MPTAAASINAAPISSSNHSENIRVLKASSIFDLDFYNRQLNQTGSTFSLSDAISHYLHTGAKNNLDPHPLFDTEFYIKTNTDVDFNIWNPLTHFVAVGWQQNRNPHPLFDVQYYLDEYKDVYKAKINPLQHFIVFGAREHRHPCDFFDSVRYKKQVHDLALIQFFADRIAQNKNIRFSRRLKTTKIRDISSAPVYLAPYIAIGKRLGILKQIKGYQLEKISPLIKPTENPLLHFLSQGFVLGFYPFSCFELLYDVRPRPAQFCRIIPRDLADLQNVPSKFKALANRINKARLPKHKLPLLKTFIESLTLKNDSTTFLEAKDTILLVSHQAAYTGSPMLLLQIAKALSARGYESLLLLEQGGELEAEFSKYAHIINFNYKFDRHRKCEQFFALLFDELRIPKPRVCLLNSLETGHYAKAIDKQGINIISLVHEIVDSYSPGFLQDIFDRSQSVIFPANFVQNFFHKKLGAAIKSSREVIIPTALLDDSFGKNNREQSRYFLREEIEAPQDSLIVLACGSPDLRKGIDHFITLARIILSKQHSDQLPKQPVHFVWLGASKEIVPWSAHYYIDWDLRQDNMQSHIHLLAPKKDLRSVFRGSDIFILPSRQDPFPIVVHNAMAAELPIVGFKDAGGVPEMVAGGGAKIVAYGDILGFTQAIEEYLTDETRRLEDGRLNASLVAERFRFSAFFTKLEAEIGLFI